MSQIVKFTGKKTRALTRSQTSADRAAQQLTDHTTAQALPSFTCFSKLPPELRIMIWMAAFKAPQVHVLKFGCPDGVMWNGSSKAAIAKSCKEASEVAQKLALNTFCIVDNGSLTPRPKYYVNLLVDTFCLVDYGDADIVPGGERGSIRWFVNNQERQAVRRVQDPARFRIPELHVSIHVRKLAIPLCEWVDPLHIGGGFLTVYTKGTIETLVDSKAEELFIVVGHDLSDQWYSAEGEFEFVEPIQAVNRLSPQYHAMVMMSEGARGDTWEALAKDTMKKFQKFKDDCAAARAEFLREHGHLPDFDNDNCWDLSEWKIPTVRFVTPRLMGAVQTPQVPAIRNKK